MPYAALTSAVTGLSGSGSRLVLEAVAVPVHPERGALTGTVTAGADGESWVFDPPDLQLPPTTVFVVLSGPCTLAEDGQCVGRWPGGYQPNERCQIAVRGAGGTLGSCPVFDVRRGDSLTLAEGSTDYDADECEECECPAGVVYAGGQILTWQSDDGHQGDGGGGLPESQHGPGGGWQICFA